MPAVGRLWPSEDDENDKEDVVDPFCDRVDNDGDSLDGDSDDDVVDVMARLDRSFLFAQG